VDVRVVAASNRELRLEVAEGRFRSDLFYRLNVVHVPLPPLRERKDDIPLLVNHFLRKYSMEGSPCSLKLEAEVMRLLLNHPWPGNVRELENVIERAVILCNGEEILTKDLPPELHAVGQEVVTPQVGVTETVEEKAREPVHELPPLDPGDRIPQWGLRPRQLNAMNFIQTHGYITNRYYSQLNDISERQALRELSEMVDTGMLERIGKGRACRYVFGPNKALVSQG
jgi:two-component system NtrC family response regulator